MKTILFTHRCVPAPQSLQVTERQGYYMDCLKVGKLIYRLRNEKDYTQKQLADAMNISDKTISKWERGV